MFKGVHHIGLSTSNLKRLQNFYCDILGFELLAEMDWAPGTEFGEQVDRIIGHKNSAAKIALIQAGNVIVELFEYSAPTPRPVDPEWRGYDHGYTHLCLEVEDIDAAYDRLIKAGMTFHAMPPKEAYDGNKCLYGRDPEGHVIELIEFCADA